jgi:hypothetical protein
MDKKAFIDRLILAGSTARKFAETLDYVKVKLPVKLTFTIHKYNDPRGTQSKFGKLKFLGGRFLNTSELQNLSAPRAAPLLWVDGKVPSWINVSVKNYNADSTEIMLEFSKTLVPADEAKLLPDIGMKPNDALVPFRIRGPIIQDWIIREKINKNLFNWIIYSVLSTFHLGRRLSQD